MNKDLTSYVRIYNNFIDANFCQETVSQLTQIEFQRHTYYNNVEDKFVSFDKELSTSYEPINNTKPLSDKIWHGIQQYIDDINSPYFTHWQGYAPVRFNKYDQNTQMKSHCDHIHTIFDGERRGIPILTILGLLNDNFDGGEFVMFEDQTIRLQSGDLIIFPSNFLYPHQVKEITSGIRYSFVSWVW